MLVRAHVPSDFIARPRSGVRRDLLDRWLNERFKDGTVRVPYAQGFERKMIKIRGRVLPKEEVLRQNLLPEWPESVKYQRERAKKQLQKAHELVQQAALRHAEKGIAIRAPLAGCCVVGRLRQA